MPYVITTIGDPHEPRDRTAVATLDEARWYVSQLVHMTNDGRDERKRVDRAIGEAGGTCPLPDGTVIEVRQVQWDDLKRLAGQFGDNGALILDAYNRSNA